MLNSATTQPDENEDSMKDTAIAEKSKQSRKKAGKRNEMQATTSKETD